MFAGAKAPLLTPFLDPEEAVDIAYRGFKKNKYLVRAPTMVKLTPALRGVLPQRAFDVVSRVFGITHALDHFQGHSSK